MLIQSLQTTECVLLRSRDVLSFTLLRDGAIIAQRSRGGESAMLGNLSSDCERIVLRVETAHKDYPQLELELMPFRFEKASARDDAMDAAREIVSALDEILDARE